MFPAPWQRLVPGPHGPATTGCWLGHFDYRKTGHGGIQTMKTTHLEEKRKVLIEKREKLIDRFNKAARARKSTTRVCTEIGRTNDFLESLEQIAAENTGRPNTGPQRYVVSSLFLHESFKKLTADPDEQFFFITGSEIDGVLVLDQWAEFTHQRRN